MPVSFVLLSRPVEPVIVQQGQVLILFEITSSDQLCIPALSVSSNA
jgi:hypothetical protein